MYGENCQHHLRTPLMGLSEVSISLMGNEPQHLRTSTLVMQKSKHRMAGALGGATMQYAIAGSSAQNADNLLRTESQSMQKRTAGHPQTTATAADTHQGIPQLRVRMVLSAVGSETVVVRRVAPAAMSPVGWSRRRWLRGCDAAGDPGATHVVFGAMCGFGLQSRYRRRVWLCARRRRCGVL